LPRVAPAPSFGAIPPVQPPAAGPSTTPNRTGAPRPVATVAPLVNRPTLKLQAKLTPEGETLRSGLVWRVFREPDVSAASTPTVAGPGGATVRLPEDDDWPLVATSTGGEVEFTLDRGTYFVHAAFGKAGATSKVTVEKGVVTEQLVLNAGGLKLHAANVGDIPLATDLLTFDVIPRETAENGGAPLIEGARAGGILRLTADTYQVISRYGSINATARTTLQVQPGKLTEATLYHKAARVTLKLVTERGGEGLANTRWDIQTRTGERLARDMITAFPTVVLAEGTYVAVGIRQGVAYSREFTVTAGRDIELEVLAEKPR
jgi:hypothetical protein